MGHSHRNTQCVRSFRFVTVGAAAFLMLLTSTGAVAQTTAIFDVQYTTDPSGDSPLVGQIVTVEGVVTAEQLGGFYVTDALGAWSSVLISTFASGCDLTVGDEVTVTGLVNEYFEMTVIGDPSPSQLTTCSVVSSGNTSADLPLATVDVAQEQYESVLVKVENVSVVGLLTYGEWAVDDGSGPTMLNDDMDYRYAPSVADSLTSITGVVNYSYGAFKINPRVSEDIVIDPQLLHYALLGDVVTMNDALDVLEDHYVEIDGEHIVGITAAPPSGVQVVDVDGLIFPGLIDAHNHPQYNVLDRIPFGQLFEHREEWRSHPLNGDFTDQWRSIVDFPTSGAQRTNIWKLAEVRALAAGTTMIQGSNTFEHSSDPYARLGMGIHNVGRFPSHAYSITFPLSYGYWPETLAEYWNRFNIHLSEGTNQTALDEFYTLVGAYGLDERVSIIHGVPYGPPEWVLMAATDAHLIWSPRSNWELYGATAQVPDAIAAGVNVALSVDWTPSGGSDILDELRFAQQISNDHWSGALTTEFLAKAVTRNAADALGIHDRVGQIASGFDADLAVFPGDPTVPYDALLQTHPGDVKLTVVGGRPSYGDPILMDQFTTLENVEDLEICGATKRLVLAVDNFAIPESDRPFGEVMDQLWEAYQQSSPRVSDFMSIDPCRAKPVFLDGFESSDTTAWSSAAP